MIRRFTWDIVYHETLDSTNSFLYNLLNTDSDLKEGYVLRTGFQTTGRGQIGNTWESTGDRNLLASILLKPDWPVEEQFVISKIICLALVELLNEMNLEDVRIKWPNDIYVGDKKIAGVLIQNVLKGKQIKASIVGVGLNINQEVFYSDAPNPTSLSIELKKKYNVNEILLRLLDKLDLFYNKLLSQQKSEIDNLYKFLLFRRNVNSKFVNSNGETFQGIIKEVTKSGQLVVKRDSYLQQFAFREIKYIL